MRTRRYEIEAVVEVLEKDHGSAEAAAQAVWDCVVGELAKRDCHAVGTRLTDDGGLIIGFGPFWDLRSANTFASKLPGQAATKFLFGVSRLADIEGICPDCNHEWMAHLDKGCVIGYDARLPDRSSHLVLRSTGCGCTATREAA